MIDTLTEASRTVNANLKLNVSEGNTEESKCSPTLQGECVRRRSRFYGVAQTLSRFV